MPRDNSLALGQSSDWQGADRPHGRRLPIYRLAGNSKKVDVYTKKPASDGRVFQNVLEEDLSLPLRPQRPEGRLCRLIFQ